jgi:23S rRNA pseudouridine1911/1915/1917 synthase
MTHDSADLVSKVLVLWEDEDIAALYKPAGLMVHSDGKSTEKTLCDFIVEKWPQTKDVGEPLKLANGTEIPRPGIVHRLDRETSGVLVIAKTKEAHAHLKEQFQGREAKKIYRAFTYGKMKELHGSINLPLGRSKGDFRQFAHPPRARGEMREALTYFTTLEAKKDFSYLELQPKTGRTHQIRAHLKAIQHPVVCDRVYAKSKAPALGFERVALHAWKLTFSDLSGKEITIEAPLPSDFIEAERQFRELAE